MLRNKTLMILSPHADDAEIGCGGIIARAVDSGSKVVVLLATVGSVKFLHHGEVVTANTRLDEFRRSMNALGVQEHRVLTHDLDTRLNTHPMGKMVNALDEAQNEFKPDILLLPLPSFHQDHKYCWEAGVASTRPSTSKHAPSLVAAYEYPLSFWGGNIGAASAFGGVHVDVSAYWAQKTRALEQYSSQVSEGHGLVSMTGVDSLARLRGLEIGVQFAETLYVLRYKV